MFYWYCTGIFGGETVQKSVRGIEKIRENLRK
jgi:hypothetical protein